MTLRDILERAHCCDALLAFAAQQTPPAPAAPDEDGHCQRCGTPFEDPRSLTHECPPGFSSAPQDRFRSFRDLWLGIERHDWLTWLMRHCPDQFEDSWRDVTSALHSVGTSLCWLTEADYGAREREVCRLIREHVRLRGLRLSHEHGLEGRVTGNYVDSHAPWTTTRPSSSEEAGPSTGSSL